MQLWAHVRLSVRGFARSPGSATAVLLAAAIGIGANTAVFGFLGGLSPEVMTNAAENGAAFQLSRIRSLIRVAGAFVFAISMATVVGALLSRAGSRLTETATRAALGARRRHLVVLLAADGLVVAGTAAFLGVFWSWWMAQYLPAVLYAEDAEHLAFVIDVRGTAIATLASASLIFIAALSPLAKLYLHNPAVILLGAGSAVTNVFAKWRSLVVSAQVFLFGLGLASVDLMSQRVTHALHTDWARTSGRLYVARIEVGQGRATESEARDYFDELVGTLGDVPLALMTVPPGAKASALDFWIEMPPAEVRTTRWMTSVFDGAKFGGGASATAGRLFGGGDVRGLCTVAVISSDVASRTFGGDPLGRLIVGPGGIAANVIGVVAASNRMPDVYLYGPQLPLPQGHSSVELWKVDAHAEPRPRRLAYVNRVRGSLGILGLTVTSGRSFDEGRSDGSCGQVLVNDVADQELFSGRAVGAAVVAPSGDRFQVVGVVRASTARTLQPRAVPTVYFSGVSVQMALVTPGPAPTPERPKPDLALAGQISSVAGGELTGDVITLDEYVRFILLPADRIVTALITILVALAVALCAIGVSGTLSDMVQVRRDEIALMTALGASPFVIARDVVWHGLKLSTVGVIAGLLVFSMQWLIVPPLPVGQSGPSRLLVQWVAPLGMLMVVGLGTILPVTRALRIDPARLLRR